MQSYDLKFPIKGDDGKEKRTVQVRGPIRVADVMHVAQDAPNDKVENVYLVARMCGLDISEVEQLEIGDFNALHAMMMGKTAGADPS